MSHPAPSSSDAWPDDEEDDGDHDDLGPPPSPNCLHNLVENLSLGDDADPTTPDTAIVRSLATFLRNDIQPGGSRILLPSLTTPDRLALSECSRGLLGYRYNLSSLKIVGPPHPSAWPVMEALERLLLKQQSPGIRHLRIDDESLLQVLELASRGCFARLQTLKLIVPDLGEGKAERHVWQCFSGRGLANLEELRLRVLPPYSHAHGLRETLTALARGACPRIRGLWIMYPRRFHEDYEDLGLEVMLEDFGSELADAIKSGHLRHLQQLDMSEVFWDLGGLVAIADALGSGACPFLRALRLSHCSLTSDDGRALGAALRSGACTQLECLSLEESSPASNAGLTAILGALAAGHCPRLKLLDLSSCRLNAGAALALRHYLRSAQSHQHLQHLLLSHGLADLEGSDFIFGSIMPAFPSLLRLHVSDCQLTIIHARMLGATIRGGGLPTLEELDITSNSLGDVGVGAIMVGLERGECPHLKELKYLATVGMGPQGGRAVARALASGNLSCLQSFCPYPAKYGSQALRLGDDVMAEVIQGLKKCPKLRRLILWGTGMGERASEALIQGLQADAWPLLEELDASDNPQGLCGNGLAEVFEEGGGARLKMLDVLSAGLGREGGQRLLEVLSTPQRRGRGSGGEDGAGQGEKMWACPRLEFLRMDAPMVDEWNTIYQERMGGE